MLEYETVVEGDANKLNKKVNELLNDGWELRGDTFVRGLTYVGSHFYLGQTLTKETEKERKEI